MVYQIEHIDEHIEKYGAINRQGKETFAETDTYTHYRIFNEMLKSVENRGEGLAEISYNYRGKTIKFFTESEIIHMKYVADMIDLMKAPFTFFLILAGLISVVMIIFNIRPYVMTDMFWISGFLLLPLSLSLQTLGFEKVFFWIHEIVFPDNHQWFFYYEDSLMSTLLKAPESFSSFGIVLGIFSLLVFVLFYPALYWFISLFNRKNLL
jgi:hypothetical protein